MFDRSKLGACARVGAEFFELSNSLEPAFFDFACFGDADVGCAGDSFLKS